MSNKRASTAYEVSNWLTYITRAEVDALKSIVNSLPPRPHIINIGAGAGTSGLAIMEARDDAQLTTIDITFESSPYGCLMAESGVLTDAGILPGANYRYGQIHGDSKEIGKTWSSVYNKSGLADFVFVDGDHSYEGARGDISIWLKNLAPNGIMAVHDYKKVDAYCRINNVSKEDLDIEAHTKIKAWYHVDDAVDDLLIPHFDRIFYIDALVAFRI